MRVLNRLIHFLMELECFALHSKRKHHQTSITCLAPGASLCYLLARAVGREAAVTYFPARVQSFREKLEQNREELPFFLLFLRLFPMSPNWALNMASGVLGKNCTLFVHQIIGIVEVYFWSPLISYFLFVSRSPPAPLLPLGVVRADAVQLPVRDERRAAGRDLQPAGHPQLGQHGPHRHHRNSRPPPLRCQEAQGARHRLTTLDQDTLQYCFLSYLDQDGQMETVIVRSDCDLSLAYSHLTTRIIIWSNSFK